MLENHLHRRSGGIGRHAILRGWWATARASSILAFGTKSTTGISDHNLKSLFCSAYRTYLLFMYAHFTAYCIRHSKGNFPEVVTAIITRRFFKIIYFIAFPYMKKSGVINFHAITVFALHNNTSFSL